MKFADVIGLEEIKQKLVNSVANAKVSHAILFNTSEGNTGLPLAFAFAQYMNCTDKQNNDSCGVCPSCHKMQKMIHPDVHFSYPVIKKEEKPTSDDFISQWRSAFLENPYLTYFDWLSKMEAENKQGNIAVFECHRIIKKLSLKAFESKYKILLMWLPEHLGKNGNTLLKIIEEPPENTIFLFVTQNRDLILNTILSRTQQIMLPPLSDQDVADHLGKQLDISASEAIRIAGLAAGNYSEALRISQAEQHNHAKEFIDWMRLCWKNDGVGIYKWVMDFSGKGREYQKDFLLYGHRLIRESLLIKNKSGQLSHLYEEESRFSYDLSVFLEPQKAQDIYDLLNKSHYHVERNTNPKILFFNLSLQLNKILRN